jgi:2-polyprenyl-6-hydroxyphenyl methylase/3-demethylubiquinone-9 3-methyltransferase
VTRIGTRSQPAPAPDPFVEYYEKQSVSPESFARFGRVLELMLRMRATLGLTTARLDVVDIGCNAGTQSFMWAERGHAVHGLDINAPLLEIARRRGRDRGLDIDFREGTATSLPWPDASMDVCLMPELLEHIPEWEPCLAEAARVLRPGGVIYLSTTNRLCPRQMEFELPLYGWYPRRLKRRYERLAVTTRPELVNHAKFPAVNWFTPYELRRQLARLGFRTWDHFDWIDGRQRGRAVAVPLALIRAIPPLRWLAHVATPYTMVLGARER